MHLLLPRPAVMFLREGCLACSLRIRWFNNWWQEERTAGIRLWISVTIDSSSGSIIVRRAPDFLVTYIHKTHCSSRRNGFWVSLGSVPSLATKGGACDFGMVTAQRLLKVSLPQSHPKCSTRDCHLSRELLRRSAQSIICIEIHGIGAVSLLPPLLTA